MNIKKLTLTGLATLSVLAGGLMSAGPALAKQLYLPDYSFGSEGPGGGSIPTIQGLAVDHATGDVYVYSAAGTLSKFNSAGEPAEFTALHTNVIAGVGVGAIDSASEQVAIDESSGPASGDIYVATGDHVAIYGADGTSLGELTSAVSSEVPGAKWFFAEGVAVDPTGHVYVAQFFSYVNKYTPLANPVRNVDYTSAMRGFEYGIGNEAVDSEGHVYSQSVFASVVERYDVSDFGTGQLAVGRTIDGEGRALALDPSTNDLFVDEQAGRIAQFDSTGTLIRRFATLGGESYGVGVNGSTHEVYVANGTSGLVEVFKLVDVTAPAVNDRAPAASGVTRTTATLSGTLDPEGYSTHYKFVYGPSSSYVHSTPELDGGAGAGDQATAPAALEGLAPGTTYHYALVATNPAGTTTGPDQTFTTAALTAPVVGTGAADGVSQTAATLTGSVDMQGLAGTYGFELGTSAGQYGPRIGLGLVRAGDPASAPTVDLESLEPGTTYHYRITATNSDGTTYGADQAVTTAVLESAYVRTPPSLRMVATPAVAFPKDSGVAPKAATNAQKLAKALKACKKKAKSKRAACERQAHKKYPTVRKKTKKK